MSAARRLAIAFALTGALAPALARAQGSPSDSLLRAYVRAMADSTRDYFGITAQAPDTAGLDSALAYGLAHPRARPRRRLRFLSVGPAATFSRVLGAAYGGRATLSFPGDFGRLEGQAVFANGPDRVYGDGAYVWSREDERRDTRWTVTAGAGRTVDGLERERFERELGALAAFVTGNDWQDYLRRDGVRVRLGHASPAGWQALGWRDQLESPLATTATWTLFRAPPVVIPNAAAIAGRAHEVEADLGLRVPRSPFSLEARSWSAGGPLGGDFRYQRTRFSAGGGLPLGRVFALAPQLEYGRLTGAALPQEAFYLGGSTLRTLDPDALQGTGEAYAHVDLILQDDVQRLLGFREPSTFPIQLGAFAGSGAVWGVDPASGRAAPTPRDAPHAGEWRSEAGLSALYRPGLPAPDWVVRLDYAWPLGDDGRRGRFYVSYRRALDVLSRH